MLLPYQFLSSFLLSLMVRIETSPEDLAGMSAAEGILTARGGMTSHAAVVARGMGKCCVSGAGALNIDYRARTLEIDGKIFKEGDYISLNGSTGEVYDGKVDTRPTDISGDFAELMTLADKYARLKVYANADTPHVFSRSYRYMKMPLPKRGLFC